MLEKAIEKIREKKAKKVLIQSPEGLKTKILEIAKMIEKEGAQVLISCEPTYGGCDLRDREAMDLGCDLLLHIGHTDFGVKPVMPVIYEPYEIDFDPLPLLEKHIKPLRNYKKICLVTTSQFLKTINTAKEYLEKHGIEVLVDKHKKANTYGQILGCDCSAALSQICDCYLYLGSGKFHPLGLALKTEIPVLALDFETGELQDYTQEKKRLEKIRVFHISQARDARKFGILLTTKKGQGFIKNAEEIKKKLESKNKAAWILVMDEITPSKIMGMDLDVLVNCACPRMSEDTTMFKKPILRPEDIDKI